MKSEFAHLVLMNVVDRLDHVQGEVGALELGEGVVARPHHREELAALQQLQHHQAVFVLLVVVVDVHHPLALGEPVQEVSLLVHKLSHLFVRQLLILGGIFLSCCLVSNLVNLSKSSAAQAAKKSNVRRSASCLNITS